MKAKLCTFSLIAILFCANALAYSPAAGLWWSPQESGRGYTIDVQEGTMLVTAYVYDGGGKATWFLASGQYNNATNTFSGTLGAFTGGQCFGCPYSYPTGVAAGTATIHFTSPETGVLTYPGGQANIQHEAYAYASKQEYLYGEWAFTNFGTGGSLDTEWVVFNTTFTSSTGTHYIAGSEDGRSGTASLGLFSNGAFTIITGDNSFEEAYIFDVSDDRRMLGKGAIFLANTSPPIPTRTASGSKLLFKSELTKSLGKADTAQPDPNLLARLAAHLEAM